MKRLITLLGLLGFTLLCRAQNMVQVEYFFGPDAGTGKNRILTVAPQANGSIPLNVLTTGLTAGHHILSFRVKDDQGNWGITQRHAIEIPATQNKVTMDLGEYFFDSDPGYGGGISMALSGDSLILHQFQAQVGNLAPGFHKIYIRFRDHLGHWGQTLRHHVEITGQGQDDAVRSVEYFIGTDPGFGNATKQVFANPAADGSFVFHIPAGQFPTSGSKLFTRVADQFGNFSHTAVGLDTVTCIAPAQPAALAFQTACSSAELNFTVAPVGSATGYFWTAPAGWYIVSGQGTSAVKLRAPVVNSNTTYNNLSVAAIGDCDTGAARLFSAEIIALPRPVITTAGGVSGICEGSSLELLSNTASGNQWYRNGILISGAVSNKLLVTQSGDYTVRVANNNGCAGTSPVFKVAVGTNPGIPVITPASSLGFCEGDSVELSASVAAGYQWFKNGASIANATNRVYVATTTGQYTVRVNNVAGCTASSTATQVTVNAQPVLPVITTDGPLAICEGSSILLTSSASQGNQWLRNGSVIAGATQSTLSVNTAGTYSVRVTNATGCFRTSGNTVISSSANPAKPVVTASGPKQFCSGDSVILSSSSATSYQWLKDGTVMNGATANQLVVKAGGEYSVRVFNVAGCTGLSDAAEVTVSSIPPTPTINRSNADLVSSIGSGYQWYNESGVISGATAQLYRPTVSAHYSVRVSLNGCTSAASAPYYFLVTGILDPITGSGEILVYPNPVKDKLQIRGIGRQKVRVQVLDLLGRKLLEAVGFRNNDYLSVAGLARGMIYVVVYSETGAIITRKLLLKE